jgi:hypothetical protein
MPRLEAIAAVIFRVQRDLEYLLCESERIIIEFAIIVEAMIDKTRIFSANL